jgi:DNA-binding IclR family transcriptional regulator
MRDLVSSQVRSVQRVLAILEVFAEHPQPATLSTLARALELPKSSCLALLRTLEAAGYLYEVAPRAGYYPTRKWLENARIVSEADPIAIKLRPALRTLHDKTGETVLLARRSEAQVIYVDVIESAANIRYSARPGQFMPIHATASGKALMGHMSEAARRRLLDSIALPFLTPETITDRHALEVEIAAGEARGWHMTVSETESDATGLAKVVELAGEPYAFVVGGPSSRIAPRLDELGAMLGTVCASASAA